MPRRKGEGRWVPKSEAEWERFIRFRDGVWKKGPWNAKFTVQKLNNIQLRVDRANFLRFALVVREACKAEGRRITSRIPENVWKAIRKVTGAGYRLSDEAMYMRWDRIGACADALGVPMELLIDEDYYFDRWGWAGYRILCEAHRQGMSLADLTYVEEFCENPRAVHSWYRAWYAFIVGRGMFKTDLPAWFLSRIIQVCNERLGMPLSALVGRPLHTSRAVGLYGELCNILGVLGKRECAFLAGVAKALSDSRIDPGHRREKLTDDVNRLLEWYFDGPKSEEEQGGCPCDRRGGSATA